MFDISYSRIVYVTKVTLPLIALALLSTLFLVSERPDPADALPFADVDVTQRAGEQRITGPTLSGRSEDGVTFSFAAEYAKPEMGNPNRMRAEDVRLAVDGLKGAHTVFLKSAAASVDTQRRLLRLLGDVTVRDSLGFVVNTDAVLVNMGVFSLVSPGQIRGISPFGTIAAGRMHIVSLPNKTGVQLIFEDGVGLVYDPNGS